MPADTLPLLDSLSALADPVRSRMLWLLDQQELTVSELCAILQLPQSTVSRHLKMLADAEWVQVAAGRHEPLLHARPRQARTAPIRRSGS